jgi:ribosomal protein S18 acetylase RimI-like enzyme
MSSASVRNSPLTPHSDFSIRSGTEADRPWIMALGRTSMQEGASLSRPLSDEQATAAFESHASFVFSRDHETLIAHNGEERLGFLFIVYDIPDQITGEQTACFTYLAIMQQSRRSGIGRALALLGFARARARGCKRGSSMVSAGNLGARRLYEELGWQVERLEMSIWLSPEDQEKSREPIYRP